MMGNNLKYLMLMIQTLHQKRGPTKRGSSYTIKEDELLVMAWLEVSQDPIQGAEQRGSSYWKRIHEYFHEWKNYPPWKFVSDRNECSLQSRWGVIQDSCNKFCGAYDQITNRKISGMGIKEHVRNTFLQYHSPFCYVATF